MEIRIVIATHKPYWMPSDPMYLPVHVGAAGKDSIGYQRDDEGENISLKNAHYCELTGLYCAGCGSGRAIRALLRGDFAAAFSYNCMLFLLGIPCIAVLIYEYVRIVFPGLRLKPASVSREAAVFATMLIAAFWILRNLPALSFLAPGE